MNLWMAPRKVWAVPYLMAIWWVAAIAAIPLHTFTHPTLFLTGWASPTFFALLPGFIGLMTLWDFPETRQEHPRLRTTLLVMMFAGLIIFWMGLGMYVGNHQ